MDFQDVVRRRHMVRSYSAEPVSADAVDRMLRNAVRAPSAGFSQGWGFLVVDRPVDVERFWASATPDDARAAPDRWLRGMRTAPVVIVPFSCKSGVCSTCRAKLIEGQVRMDRNFALEKHEVAAGFVLTCQSHPLTDRVVVSFDER